MLVYCGQTVGWIKMPIGTEVGRSPDDTVLDGDQFPRTERGTALPHVLADFALARAPISAKVMSSCFSITIKQYNKYLRQIITYNIHVYAQKQHKLLTCCQCQQCAEMRRQQSRQIRR